MIAKKMKVMRMASNFQRDRSKFGSNNQTDIYNADFNSFIKPVSDEQNALFTSTLEKSYYCASYFRWFP